MKRRKSYLHYAARRPFIYLLLCCLCPPSTLSWGQSADGSDSQQPIRYLGIGNSFTWDSTAYLDEIAASQGKPLDCFVAGIGGASMESHIERMELNRRDPDDPRGKPYLRKRNGTAIKYSLTEILQAERWDVVSIQQVSTKSFLPETYEPFAQELIETIRTHAPQAEIVIHMTWAYRADHPWFVSGKSTQPEMHDGLTAAYKVLSERYGLRINPIGEAVAQARAMDNWSFSFPDPSFDYDHPTTPALPRQAGSLIEGWHWKNEADSEMPALRLDAIHLNKAGRYLGALTQFGFLFESEPSEQAFRPEGLSPQQTASLRQAAHLALEKYRDFNEAAIPNSGR